MTIRGYSVAFALLILSLGSGRSAAQDTQRSPGETDETDRLTFLGNQLANIDASLEAIDQALAAAGFKAKKADSQTKVYEKGNELMDRKGGGPVPWKKFYGTVAKDFYVQGRNGNPKQVKRPSQFKYVYRANDKHIQAAKAEVARLDKTSDVLMARRRKLQSEQAMLWATIALEMVQNRNIPTESIYHWRLKSTSKASSAENMDLTTKQLEALQASALFLRTVDGTAMAGIEKLKTNQENVYTTLRDLVRESKVPAQEAVLRYRDTVGESTTEGRQMVALIDNFKGMESQTRNFCDAYRQAATIDALKEEQREDELRGQLQAALFGFAQATSRLDDAVTALANEWGIVGDTGVELVGLNLPAFDSSKGAEEIKTDAAPAGDKTAKTKGKAKGKKGGQKKKGAQKKGR